MRTKNIIPCTTEVYAVLRATGEFCGSKIPHFHLSRVHAWKKGGSMLFPLVIMGAALKDVADIIVGMHEGSPDRFTSEGFGEVTEISGVHCRVFERVSYDSDQ